MLLSYSYACAELSWIESRLGPLLIAGRHRLLLLGDAPDECLPSRVVRSNLVPRGVSVGLHGLCVLTGRQWPKRSSSVPKRFGIQHQFCDEIIMTQISELARQ